MKAHTTILPLALLLPAIALGASHEAPSGQTDSEITQEPQRKQTETSTDTIPVSVELEELEVVSSRPIIKSDGAKLSYDIKEDISTKGLTLSDALRKVPMVTVDGEGKIRINGQDNFKIYLNGKEDPSLSANYKDIFKAMPAEAVLKVEVITEPGAKYDAEGTAGILNLITITRNSTDGQSATLTANFSKQQSGVSVYGRMKHGKLSMSADINYANGSIFPQTNWNEHNLENLASETARYQYNKLQQKVGWDYIGGGFNISYDLTDRDLLTLNANVTTMAGKLKKGGYSYFEAHDAQHQFVGSSMRSLQGKLTESSLNVGFS